MTFPPSRGAAALACLAMIAVIVHGSLWPYVFAAHPGPLGPVGTLIRSMHDRPPHFTDFFANVLLYVPLGGTLALALPGRGALRLLLAVALGMTLSVTMELTQFYDAGRVTDFYDVCSNTLGTLVGALAATILRTPVRIPVLGRIAQHPVPALLLVAMLGYRFVPYVPTTNVHQYWNAVKPLLTTALPAPEAVFRYFAIWLTAFALLAELFGATLGLLAMPLLAGFVLLGKILVIGSTLSWAELAGLAAAILAWPALHRAGRLQPAIVAAILLLAVLADRLLPFDLQPTPRPFGWIPFRAFMQGSLTVDTAAFFQKLFLYGSLFWLLARAGLSRPAAAIPVAGLLLATSLAETYLPGRSAEITDPVMALLTAALLTTLHGWAQPAPRRATAAQVQTTARARVAPTRGH